MFIIKYYLAGAIAALVAAFVLPHWYFSFIFAWTSIALIVVSVAYIFDSPGVFRKRQDGSIPLLMMLVLLPFLLGAQLYNSWARRQDSVPAIQRIETNIYLGCRLFPSDIEHLKSIQISAILDATSEFSGLNWSAKESELAYLNVPILDHTPPHTDDLLRAITWISNQIKNGRKVVIHCALGRGRSVLITAAYLLTSGKFASVDEALNYINEIRGTAKLNNQQYRKLKDLYESGILSQKKSLLLIANPVSGGGSWQAHKAEIEQRLSVKYELDFILTTNETSAKDIAHQNKHKPYKMIVACGGDGTVNEVASALIHTNVLMGIIPLGTTNALAHVLMGSNSKIKPVETACNDILLAKSSTIDTAICNDEVVLLVTGIGFEQKMIRHADRTKKDENGEMAYIEGLSAAIRQNEINEYELSIDNKPPRKVLASSIIIANAAPFTTVLAQGGDAPDPADGLLDMTILNTQNSVTLPLLSLMAKQISRPFGIGSQTDAEGIETMQVKKVSIRQSKTIDYVIDGELRSSQSLEISILSHALRITHSEELRGTGSDKKNTAGDNIA